MRLKDSKHLIDLPREKLLKYGPEKLKDEELVAILLRSGTPGMNVLELSKKILRLIKKSGIDSIDKKKLQELPGIGPVKAAEVIACFEIGKRMIAGKKTTIILKPEDIWNRMADIRSRNKEHFVIFYLDSRNQEIEREVISIGTLNENLIHPREVYESAIKRTANSIVAVHNHPSGNPEPSDDDLKITRMLVGAGRILGIELADHVIVADDGWFSFAEKGLII